MTGSMRTTKRSLQKRQRRSHEGISLTILHDTPDSKGRKYVGLDTCQVIELFGSHECTFSILAMFGSKDETENACHITAKQLGEGLEREWQHEEG
jgi:hypothetical protein